MYLVRSAILMVEAMKISVLWGEMTCSLADCMMEEEAAKVSKTVVTIYQTTW
jgi:hypothetical protein